MNFLTVDHVISTGNIPNTAPPIQSVKKSIVLVISDISLNELYTGFLSIISFIPRNGKPACKKFPSPNIRPPATSAGINGTNISARCATILCKKGCLVIAVFLTSSLVAPSIPETLIKSL